VFPDVSDAPDASDGLENPSAADLRSRLDLAEDWLRSSLDERGHYGTASGS